MTDHVAENQRYWDNRASEWVAAGERAWAADSPFWGMWEIPDHDVALLPGDMTGLDAIELGCGTGYVSAWMHRRGATVTGIDNSAEQLATAKRLAATHGANDIEWIHGNAEQVPKPDASYDFAASEYGAAIWCDPNVWIPEAHRLLRRGGRLVFLGHTPWMTVCSPLDGANVDFALHRNYFDVGRTDWTKVDIDPGGIEFNMPISKWFELFRRTGFRVDDYLEPQAPAELDDTPFATPAAWAHSNPSEQVWYLTKL